jgi:AraC-like DNA-binding protein
MVVTALRAETGLGSYDHAQWTGWLPAVSHVMRADSLSTLLQHLPPQAESSNETDVPGTPDLLLLCWGKGTERIDYSLDGKPFRQRLAPWDHVLVPSHCPSWWVSNHSSADEVYHVHLNGAFVSRTCAELGVASAEHIPAIAHGRDIGVEQTTRFLFDELRRDPAPPRILVDAIATSLIARLARPACRSDRIPITGGLASWQVRRSTEYLADNLDKDVTLEELAAIVRLSPFHFCRAFKKSVGLTPTNWQLQRRVERAQALMLDPETPLLEVALAVGYQSQGAFGNAFRRVTGDTPAAWRRKRLS